ncbi:hypothetical protein PHYSODRAFT_326082 [Phytophthora sojae]|uniref:Uncharacterized protein n=1 Tax=Phytophthora sojae (strain P6497) TaxID=1094619 RepID=G4YX30_PHYSP|nr:hypothetical protein PHYSODRAFT_326082 [Phytophthora sojae]EGZ25037.1 hypothetical protein PHYSODRAFT_326082 [Phytophthora sojae]|eukprot:XP_009520325.1 hypothetical protein PHYSODRAFT_326082 [Phytophthora sojae]
MNVSKTMNFLNRHNTRATQTLVNAVDDSGAQPGAYVFIDDGDDDQEEKDDDDPGAKEGSKDAPLDFTQESSAPSTPT